MSDKKYRLAIIAAIAEGEIVIGYCPDNFYVGIGDKVVYEDNGEGIVVAVDSYVTMDSIHKRVDATKLDLVRILAIKKIEYADWEEEDQT